MGYERRESTGSRDGQSGGNGRGAPPPRGSSGRRDGEGSGDRAGGDRAAGGGERIRGYRDLRVFQSAMDGAVRVFDVTARFPEGDCDSLGGELRRSARQLCASLATAWGVRRNQGEFVRRLAESESHAATTRVSLEIAARFNYLPDADAAEVDEIYDKVSAQLARMIAAPEKWAGSGNPGAGRPDSRS